MPKEPMYKISESRLASLIEASVKLEYLEAAGVDNWNLYDEALQCNFDDSENFYEWRDDDGAMERARMFDKVEETKV